MRKIIIMTNNFTYSNRNKLGMSEKAPKFQIKTVKDLLIPI